MKVYFSHGKESGPWGYKIKILAKIATELGYSVDSIDYCDILDPDLRVERLLSILNDQDDDFLLVGSSMGGYVSLVAAEQVPARGVFLLAPALALPGYAKQTYTSNAHIEIVHGWSDDVVPVQGSIDFAKRIDCSLHLIAGDHRLNDSIGEVAGLFRQFLSATTGESTR